MKLQRLVPKPNNAMLQYDITCEVLQFHLVPSELNVAVSSDHPHIKHMTQFYTYTHYNIQNTTEVSFQSKAIPALKDLSASVAHAVIDTFKSTLNSSVTKQQTTSFFYTVLEGDHVILEQAVMKIRYRGNDPLTIQSPYFRQHHKRSAPIRTDPA